MPAPPRSAPAGPQIPVASGLWIAVDFAAKKSFCRLNLADSAYRLTTLGLPSLTAGCSFNNGFTFCRLCYEPSFKGLKHNS